MIRRRRATRPVRVGGLVIGGGAPVAVQSMTNTRTDDVAATVRQTRSLARAGCELVRIAVPDAAAAAALPEIRARLKLPLCADVHFDHRLALAAIRAGFDKVRINPGNIGAGARTGRARSARVCEVIRAAADAGTAIRVGVNAGSIDRRFARRPTVAAMVASMAECLAPFEALGFRALVLSAKASGVPETVAAYRELSRRWRWPLHLGLTEAGLPFEGAIRSTAALGALLAEGIGDTVRVSLTGDPVREVEAAWELLAALGLRRRGPLVYACPTCGRTGIDVARLAREVKRALAGCREPLKIAVMGCVVNGPGEARAADYGIAGGRGRGAVFARGRVLRTVPADRLVRELLRAIAAGQART
ncbi:MAG TPA: flavodoxin-dependent (E)-4-hydroxy-3-methylbut-2-enyl-diphosphate synthase [candidate division WOR-3 bacterium]|uniref:4-hydroxy-3-methylbut-2-en-1-yl diphosphate synthase (flavodoxin) n=1 Tax=candidate division WOR-3 bacterium TaxID=2052148 RepID=A0A7V0T617_UNCW3|nr:flavodoxin-dependent (E)-4-hydroxy-3-methylbut-2-enyl-diphosphate synthase [candidate division WOR-3 bacterium]